MNRVQATPKVATSSAPSIAVVFGATPTVGNTVLFILFRPNSAPTSSVVDNKGNAYTSLVSTTSPSTGVTIEVYACLALTTSGASFTITASGGTTNRTGIAIETTPLAVDKQVISGEQVGLGTSTTGLTPALTATDEFLLAVINTGSTIITVSTVTPAWLQEMEHISSVGGEVDSRVITGATGTTQSATWALNGANYYNSLLIAFKAGTPPPPPPAFKVTVAGMDWTDAVLLNPPPRISLRQNERTTATLMLRELIPGKFVETIIYDLDGVTPVFGGVITNVVTQGMAQGEVRFNVGLDLTDFMIYLDWTTWTKSYTSPVTLHQILVDVINEGLSAYAITLSPSQDTGDTFDATADVPFVLDGVVSDIMRTLVSSCDPPRVLTVSPTKVMRAFVPGVVGPTPVTVTDANSNALSFEWHYTDFASANYIKLICGAPGTFPYPIVQYWIQAGGATTWVADIPSAQYGALNILVGGVEYTVGPYPDAMPIDYFAWEWDTRTLRLGALSAPIPNGTLIQLTYQGAFPFVVVATSGAAPPRKYVRTMPDQQNFQQAQLIADGLLARLNQEPREFSMVTIVPGFLPGQKMSNAVATERNVNNISLYVTAVDLELSEWFATPVKKRVWISHVTLTDSDIFQGSYLDQARAMMGGTVGGVSAISIGSGGTPSGGPPPPAGGGALGDAVSAWRHRPGASPDGRTACRNTDSELQHVCRHS
jgi:hypothetical protein